MLQYRNKASPAVTSKSLSSSSSASLLEKGFAFMTTCFLLTRGAIDLVFVSVLGYDAALFAVSLQITIKKTDVIKCKTKFQV